MTTARVGRGSDEVSGLPEEEVSWIRRMEAEHEAQAASADFDAMFHSFAADVVTMPPNGPNIVGRTAVRQWQAQFPPMDEYQLTVTEIQGCGDFAYVRGSYSMAYTSPLSGEGVSDSGRWMHILRRQADGSWLITHDFFSSDGRYRSPDPVSSLPTGK